MRRPHPISLASRRINLLRACATWNGLPPDAEEIAGCVGNAFQQMLTGLYGAGYIDNNQQITENGQLLLERYRKAAAVNQNRNWTITLRK